MKKFVTVLEFELMNYIKNKSYVITTVLIAVLLSVLLFLPRFVDVSKLLGIENEETKTQQVVEEDTDVKEGEESSSKMVLFDEAKVLEDIAPLKEAFPKVEWKLAENAEQVKQLVESKEVDAGFVVKSYTSYDYYLFNKGMDDTNSVIFQNVLSVLNRQHYCKEKNLNYEEIESLYQTPIDVNEEILGKDTMENFWYCYALVILIFMMIIFYGIMIATSITNEKSNRSIEVLITSASSNALLFGKVIAGAIASILQMGIILGSALTCYQMNRASWGGALDMIFNIPTEVLVTFGFFGVGGYLFYAFLYGAMGALVSKTEDVNKSAGGVQMIIMIVYFVVLAQLSNTDGMVIKIASFLPFSSYSAMFARVAMGTVAMWEILVSFAILVVSIGLVGMLGAKIYRMGTLRYGNPIKITSAIKSLRQK